MLTNEPILEW